jgi:hypothetical protein
MVSVVTSTVSTGRVSRRQFPTVAAAEKHARRREEVAARSKAGLRGIRVEIQSQHPDRR